MKRGSFAVCLALVTLLLGSTGCKQQPISQQQGFVRHQSQLERDPTTVEKKDESDSELAAASRGVLKPTRSAAWSSEARAIEADLNVK